MEIPPEFHHAFWLARLALWGVFGLVGVLIVGIFWEIFREDND